jgi:hypothetical protein
MGPPEVRPKSKFSTSKVKQQNKNSYGIYSTVFAGSAHNHKKIIETPNQPIETKKIQKKYV